MLFPTTLSKSTDIVLNKRIGVDVVIFPQDVYKLFEKAPQAVWEEVLRWFVLKDVRARLTSIYLHPVKANISIEIDVWKM